MNILKNLPRLLIPILLIAFAFVSGMDKSDSIVSGNQTNALNAKMEVQYLDSSTYHLDLQLPYQTSSANAFRSQNTSKRTGSTTYRNSFEFVRAGKIIYTGNRYLISNTTLKFKRLLVKTVYRLISLGKLII